MEFFCLINEITRNRDHYTGNEERDEDDLKLRGEIRAWLGASKVYDFPLVRGWEWWELRQSIILAESIEIEAQSGIQIKGTIVRIRR